MIRHLIFENTVPDQFIAWGIVAALAVLLLSSWRYLTRTGATVLLVGLRLLFLAALCWCLLRPVERHQESEQLKPRFLVIADTSASMGLSARKDIPTRWSVAQEILKQPWATELALKAELDGYAFDTVVTSKMALKAIGDLPVQGSGTRLRESLQQIIDRYKGQPLAGILLLSDGQDTREIGNEWAGAAWPAPIYTVRLEPPDVWEEFPEVRVVRVDTPRRVVAGWQSELTAVIGAAGTKGAALNVQLYENGKLIQEMPTQIPATGGTKEVRFQLEHKSVGNFIYKVRVPPLPKETVLEDNEFSIAVEVTDTKNRVLYVEAAPRFDFKFLKRALEKDKAISPIILLQGGDGKLMSVGASGAVNLTLAQDQLSHLKVVILGNTDAEMLGEERAKSLVKYVEEGGSLVLLGGEDAWGAKGFAATELKKVMPLQRDTNLPAQEGRYAVTLTKEGQTHPALKNVASKWDKPMPVLSLFPGATISPGATTVMSAGEQPLIVAQRFGQGKVAAILSNSLWRWQLEPGQKEEYSAFWEGMIQWLMPQAAEVNAYTLDLTADVEQLYLGDTITLTARLGGARAAEAGTMISNLEVQTPDGRKIPFPMSQAPAAATAGKNSGAAFVATYKADAGGMHNGIARATVGGNKVESAPFSFVVKPFTPETNPRPQNVEMLRALSQTSGGQFCEKEKINEALMALDVKTAQEERVSFKSLWDSPFMLAALIALLGAEWIIRKRRNMA